MELKEVDKTCRDIRRAVGRKYGYRQNDYINWKIKDGYFFCLDTNDCFWTELEVKPVFMDDIYWNAIYPDGHKRMPDSLRGRGRRELY